MTNKEKYSRFCEQEPLVPIYMRDWWLDCNCGSDKWNVLLYENGEQIEAFMTYYQPYAGTISMPMYSQSMGIWFNPNIKKDRYSKELSRKQDICDYFINHLPKHYSYLQNFHYTFTDWLSFYWNGYKQTTRYTYIIPPVENVDIIWKNLGKVRTSINKSKQKYNLKIDTNISIAALMELNVSIFQKQGLEQPEPIILKNIIQEAIARKHGAIWGAVDHEGCLHAAVFFVWQDGVFYTIADGRNLDLPNSEALSLLFWEIISFAQKKESSIDFLGSMLSGVEGFLRRFGGIQTPYFTIYKGKRGIKGTIRAGWAKLRRTFGTD